MSDVEEFTCIVPEGWECAFTNVAQSNGLAIGFGVFLLIMVVLLCVMIWRA